MGVETRQFVVALQNAGADVQVVQTVTAESSLFGVPATHLRVNGAEVAVYEFATVAEADAGVARVPFILATTTFPPGPHFYRGNRIIVLYVGQDAAMISLLDRLLGPAFAAGPRWRTGVSGPARTTIPSEIAGRGHQDLAHRVGGQQLGLAAGLDHEDVPVLAGK